MLLTRYIPLKWKKKGKVLLRRYQVYGKQKIFIISFQRTGTTSTGCFFKDHGYNVATWETSRDNEWTLDWFIGNYDRIFNSNSFQENQVFEDDPWWCLDFYRFLFHKFPKSKFILLERDPNKWFDSMKLHSKGKTLGNTHIHSKLYRREDDYNMLGNFNNNFTYRLDNLLEITDMDRENYIKIYQLRNSEIKEFFAHHAPDRLFCCALEDRDKWVKMGKFVGMRIDQDYESYVNKSNQG